MKKANEMRDTANQVIEDKRRELFEKAKAFCDNEVANLIEERASNGIFHSPIIHVPADLNMDHVINYIMQNGYKVERRAMHQIVVEW